MTSYLINLDRDIEKRDRMQGEFARLGIQFTRVSAVDGGAVSEEEFRAFCRDRPLVGNEGDVWRVWTPGVMGCFLSHRSIWQRIADSNEAAGAVFEDDIHLAPKLAPFVANFEWMPDDADIVHFETTWHGMRLGPATDTHRGIAIRRAYHNVWGAAGYALRKQAAQALLAVEPRFHAPADHFLFDAQTSVAARALRVYQLDPALVVQDYHHPIHPNSLGYQTTTLSVVEEVGLAGRLRLFLRPVARAMLRRRVVPFDEAAVR